VPIDCSTDTTSLTASVFSIMRYSTHDGPGIRSTVFFQGCPLECWWCHNPEGQPFRPSLMYFDERCRACGDCLAACPEHAIEQVDGRMVTRAICRRCGHCSEICQAEARQMAGRQVTLGELVREVEKDLIFFEESGGGVTLSGGEPAAQPKFAVALLDACRRRGIHTALETCGFAQTETFLEVALAADLVLFDLKLIDAARHERYTGVSNRRILENLEQLAARSAPMVIRIPVIPGLNDTDDDARQFAEYLAALGVADIELMPYHRIGAEKYRRLGLDYILQNTPEPGAAGVAPLSQALQQAGMRVKVEG